eukprot:1126110-Pyramimonas_sp.AAC.1
MGRVEEKGAGELVRVSGNIDPCNIQIKIPPSWSSWRKSSTGRSRDAQSWKRIEDRVDVSAFVDAEEFDRVVICVQNPRVRVGGTSYLCAPSQLDQHGVTTMKAKSRAEYCSGLRDI